MTAKHLFQIATDRCKPRVCHSGERRWKIAGDNLRKNWLQLLCSWRFNKSPVICKSETCDPILENSMVFQNKFGKRTVIMVNLRLRRHRVEQYCFIFVGQCHCLVPYSIQIFTSHFWSYLRRCEKAEKKIDVSFNIRLLNLEHDASGVVV